MGDWEAMVMDFGTLLCSCCAGESGWLKMDGYCMFSVIVRLCQLS
jgi:hypothetical protein